MMCQDHNPIECVIPPYITQRLTKSANPEIRDRAIANLAAAAAFRAVRSTTRAFPTFMAQMSPTKGKFRQIYDAGKSPDMRKKLVRSEGDPKSTDDGVNEAYDYSGDVYDYYSQLFKRNSLDDKGMTLISSVHLSESDGSPLDNAFWNGEQMAYGDGDGVIFQRFTKSLDVVGHELTHGVQSFTSNLEYQGQSGALNEHFADVGGILIRQWKNGESVAKANWLIGVEVLMPAPTRRGIRDMEHPGTGFTNDPELGTDPQPADMKHLYKGSQDNGGVHINSGIPNRAFVLSAQALGGNAWENIGPIWFETMVQLTTTSNFADCARISVQVATAHGAAAKKAVTAAWKKVGVSF
jgi:Zn-dependent metalloprotease